MKKQETRIRPVPSLPCGSCKGQCCSPITPFTHQDIKNIKRRYPKAMKDILKHNFGMGAYFLRPKNEKIDRCVFFNGTNCDIYESRPNVCKTFGKIEELRCPYENMVIALEKEIK